MSNVITITGKIGSGKSTCSTLLSSLLGYEYISADKIGHKILKHDNIKQEIRKEFGDTVFKNNTIIRNELGNIVFKDKQKLDRLTEITSPAITEELKSRIESLLTQNKGVVVEIPFIKEGMAYFGHTIEISADYVVRLNRLIKSRGLSESKARNAIDSQKGKAKVDFVVMNNDDGMRKPIRDLLYWYGTKLKEK